MDRSAHTTVTVCRAKCNVTKKSAFICRVMANEGTPRKMTTSRSHGTFLMTAVVSALIAQRAHGFLLLQFHKTTPEREAEVLGLRNSKTILALAEGVSVAMMLEEEDIVRFRTVSSIQTGTTEGLPEALAIVDALQLILPEPGNGVQHEHGYAYGRLLVEREDGSMLASEEAVQIPPEDLLEIIPYHTDFAGGDEVYCLTYQGPT